MGDPLYGGTMEAFARERREEGVRLQALHVDNDGICSNCGRLSPCESYTEGVELANRYAGFLAARPDPETPPNLLLRPYVTSMTAGGGTFPNGGRW